MPPMRRRFHFDYLAFDAPPLFHGDAAARWVFAEAPRE